MIGDVYFQLRAQVGTTLYSLAKLGRDLAAEESILGALQSLQDGLREPFVFILIGEADTGKSALLNALFDREFAGQPELSGTLVTYRHSAEPRDEAQPDGSVTLFRPHNFLRDFTLVEVPGFAPSEALSERLRSAHLVLNLLPIKGDTSTAWDFLAPLSPELLRRCVFVASHSDTVTELELPLIATGLRHLMHARLGRACPLFPISAPARAGLEKLERHIDAEIIFSPTRVARLREVCAAGRALLDGIGAPARTAVQAATRQEQRLKEERSGLLERRGESLRHAGSALWSLTRLFDSAHRRGAKLLRRKLSVGQIWSDPPSWWQEFHREVESRLRESITRSFAATFETFEADLQTARRQHHEVVQKLQLRGPEPRAHDALELFARLTADLTSCDPDGAATNAVHQALAEAQAALRPAAYATWTALAFLLGALAAGRFIPELAALVALTATVLLVVLSVVRGNVLAAFWRLMSGRRELVLGRFEDDLRSEIDRFYERLAASLHPLEEAGARRRAALDPALRRLAQLQELFTRCEVELAARRPPVPWSAKT